MLPRVQPVYNCNHEYRDEAGDCMECFAIGLLSGWHKQRKGKAAFNKDKSAPFSPQNITEATWSSPVSMFSVYYYNKILTAFDSI